MEDEFCWILSKPDYLPWFINHVNRYADAFDDRPTLLDISIRAKWLMLDKGLAATGLLANLCKENRGTCTTSVRTYRMPTHEEVAAAWLEAARQLVS